MTERGVGKPWTPEEDSLLKAAVSRYGDRDNWKNVATLVPGRTNKACRKRWLHSLSPNVKKTPWTPEEDELLLKLYAQYPEKWSIIARQITGRTDDACSKRYREALDPSLNKGDWTAEEDERLYAAYLSTGGKWREIGKLLNRSGLASRNRWRMLERKKASTAQRRGQSSTVALPSVPSMSSIPQPIDQALADPSTWEHIAYMNSEAYWEPETAYPSPYHMQESLPDSFVHQEAVYPEYSPAQTQVVPETFCSPNQRSPQPLPPFNYASSSLSSALSLPNASPSTSYLPTPESTRSVELRKLILDSSFETPPSVTQPTDSGSTAIVDLPLTTHHSPDLSSLGSTEISVPVPFPDSPQLSSHGEADTIVSPHPSIDTDTDAYPTPLSSPVGEYPAEVSDTASPSPSTTDQRPEGYYRTPQQKRKMLVEAKPATARKKTRVEGPPPRLSANLPVMADHSIKAYVCGFERCWPRTAEMSNVCYATSQELLDHWKVEHIDDATCERPFKCGIADCGKGWKSINGLQYHLQISRVHFQQAVTAKLLSERQSTDSPADDVSSEAPKKRVYRCTQPSCPNQYKQLSGLKYHLAHGHSQAQQLPTQLDMLPPALAKKVEQQIQNDIVSTA
ncbi:uncharacterized protein PHACADRAFT_246943 [Phanerochaete carnosa HHB-10118-sp]|uniref:Uncharacterized protein n=1 Tax=Phanerochaete carnosa (strain HHB-10118-sp) TaxID=650164 RepID=K5WNP4_PHACS|nr:uncharacterized protein PHACADRAFT_246943 [Phanerochaete carnosa HHB-10118-sp]EKM60799.1 hypothetical protein PHACADRAFT_246943 [Phanerochaete carnosa HHB-10118-sp]